MQTDRMTGIKRSNHERHERHEIIPFVSFVVGFSFFSYQGQMRGIIIGRRVE